VTVVLTKDEYRAVRAGHQLVVYATTAECSCGRAYSSRTAAVWEHRDHKASVTNEARRAKQAAQEASA
jgi:hypothetical protein